MTCHDMVPALILTPASPCEQDGPGGAGSRLAAHASAGTRGNAIGRAAPAGKPQPGRESGLSAADAQREEGGKKPQARLGNPTRETRIPSREGEPGAAARWVGAAGCRAAVAAPRPRLLVPQMSRSAALSKAHGGHAMLSAATAQPSNCIAPEQLLPRDWRLLAAGAPRSLGGVIKSLSPSVLLLPESKGSSASSSPRSPPQPSPERWGLGTPVSWGW